MRTRWAKSDVGKAWYRSVRRQTRDRLLAGYGGCCACCGESEPKFLVIDHVNGGGRKELRTIGPSGIAAKIIRGNFPPDYRVLCHNCNAATALYKVCPHTLTAAGASPVTGSDPA